MPEPCDYLIVDAPFPPSLNALFEPHRIGSRCSVGKSKRYTEYQKNTFNPWWLTVRSKGRLCFGNRIMLWMVVCAPRIGHDVDNSSKAICDCLEAAGAFENDNMIVSHHVERGPRITGGLLRIFIASESRREDVTRMYFEEYHSRWLPLRDGPILKQPDRLEIVRL